MLRTHFPRREQCDREQALDDFKLGMLINCYGHMACVTIFFSAGLVNVLIATDVASRGLDIKDVS